MIYKFETWMNSDVDHASLTFDDKESLDRFTRDFITEHTRWGKWVDVIDNSSVKLKKTTGDNNGEYFNLKITKYVDSKRHW